MTAKKQYYEKFLGYTPNEYDELEERHKVSLELISNFQLTRILDVGCGDGNFSIFLKKSCNADEVYGIDVSEVGVKSSCKNGVIAFQVDIDKEKFPFHDNFFDAIYAGEIIEHLYDPDHFLLEVYRCLRPNGIFIISTPNLASFYNRFSLFFGYQPPSVLVSLNHSVGHYKFSAKGAAPDHIRFFTLRSLKELLQIHRFTIRKIQGSIAVLPNNIKFSFILRVIDKCMTIFPSLSYRIIILTQKVTND
jgi:SAM-dependent methyltransferase